jgi:tripartite-type tricarboxylate transporter receptor subunit TctC
LTEFLDRSGETGDAPDSNFCQSQFNCGSVSHRACLPHAAVRFILAPGVAPDHTWEEAMKHLTRIGVCLIAFALPSTFAAADSYPDRPIRAIASQGPGGLSDIFMRALADELGPELGGTVVVENRVGAAGSIGARACADSASDGYTICILNNESMLINPIIFKNMSLDPQKELVHVTRLFYLTHVFAVNASLNVKTFDELAALARSQPKTMNYLTPSLSKVAFMEAFNKKHGVDFVRVPFKGGGDAVNSMMTGTTPVAIFGIGNLNQLIRSGKVVGFAVDGDDRSPLAPDIPTFKQLGYNLHVWASSFGIHMPAGTPKPIIDKLNKAIVKIGSKPEFQTRQMINRGLKPVLDSSEHFTEKLQSEIGLGRDVVMASGLYPDVK